MNPEPPRVFTSQRQFSGQSSDSETSGSKAQTASPIQAVREVAFRAKQDIVSGTLRESGAVDGNTGGTANTSLISPVGIIDSDCVCSIGKSDIPEPIAPGENTIFPTNTSIQLFDAQPVASSDLSSFRKTDRLVHSAGSVAPNSPHALKHPPSENLTEPASKRRRPQLIPPHTLGSETSPTGLSPEPGSPLPFSGTPGHRSISLPELSTSDAVVTMINNVQDQSEGTTTLNLARGSLSKGSPPRSTGSSGSWTSRENHNTPLDPDVGNEQSSLQLLGNVGLLEFLETDERPTFVIDVANAVNFHPGGPLQIIFANASLRAHESIFDMITMKAGLDSPGIDATNNFTEFKAWALSFVKNNESLDVCLPSFPFGGITWTCSTLRKRFRLISRTSNSVITTARSASSNGALSTPSTQRVYGHSSSNTAQSPLIREPSEPLEPSSSSGDARLKSPLDASAQQLDSSSPEELNMASSPRQSIRESKSDVSANEMINAQELADSSFDWTRLRVSSALPEHIQFARSIDWAATPLGPIDTWTSDLRAMCNLIMGSPHPAALYWGNEYISIYNESYKQLAGQRHPKMMGQNYKFAWAEMWDTFKDVFSNAIQFGQATMKDDDCLFLKRNGLLEETYFTWAIAPLVGADGSVVGLYNPAFERTDRIIAERRMLTLREVSVRTATAREVKGVWDQVIKGLEYNVYDLPFVLLYSISETSGNEPSSIRSGSLGVAPRCTLEGSLGVPQGHRLTESPLDLKTSDEGLAPRLREAMKTDGSVLLTTEDGTLSNDLIDGLEWRGWPAPCRAAVIRPIHSTTGESILGFLVMGVNPRRPYDDDYSSFVELLSHQLTTSIEGAMLFEDQIRRGQRAARLAALDRQELSKQLDLRTQEAVESETKFTRMTEFAPVGMFIANSSGEISYSNDAWWEISKHPRADNSAGTWMESIIDEDREEVRTVWKKLVEERVPVTHEFRFKTLWQDRSGTRGNTWVLMSAYPERDENGKLKSVFGSITNISQQKWAEDFQKRRLEEAFELKRQQENFIDMTSHEMRNPLSAILQCADEISTTLSEYRSSDGEANSSQKIADLLDSSIDAAETISLCAQHQKRIVDDILTLSKLDSALLIVTPVAVQPVAVVQRALKMFEGELASNDIAMEFRMEMSYLDMNIDWVKLDPSRLLQVLINLTTNAIKFTNGQDERAIVVTIGASSAPPNGTDSDVDYFPTRSKHTDLTIDEAEWGKGENIYLKFAVQDTGRGLDESEMALLFQRFRQASPRTHVQYGGSGLGLFISRELTELQGGEIGVSSERGIGSTFAFYIKARRVEHMPQQTPILASLNSLRRSSTNDASVSFTIESRRNSSGKPVQLSNTSGKIRRTSALTSTSFPSLPSASTLDYSKLKVLIVEDNLVNQRVLQKQLRNLGFNVEVANHGGEALEVLKNSRLWAGREEDGKELAVILMDLEMPVMDGLTCARTIRVLEGEGTIIKHVPIIAVTANARLEQIESAISAGMDDVVSKPFRMPELIPKIEDLVAKSNDTTPWGSMPAKYSAAGSST